MADKYKQIFEDAIAAAEQTRLIVKSSGRQFLQAECDGAELAFDAEMAERALACRMEGRRTSRLDPKHSPIPYSPRIIEVEGDRHRAGSPSLATLIAGD